MPNLINQYLEDLFNPNTGVAFEGRIDDIEVVIDTFKDDVPDNTFVKKVNDTTMTGVPASNNFSTSNSDLVIRDNGLIKTNRINVGDSDLTGDISINKSSGTSVLNIVNPSSNAPRIYLIRNNGSSNFGGDLSSDWACINLGGHLDFDRGNSGLTNGYVSPLRLSFTNAIELNQHRGGAIVDHCPLRHYRQVAGNLNNYYIDVRPSSSVTGAFTQELPNLSGEYILDTTQDYVDLNSLKTSFNAQSNGNILTKNSTNTFSNEAFGNNFLSSEIKKSSLGGVLQTQLLRTGDGGGVSFQNTGASTFSSISFGSNSAVNSAFNLPKNAGYLLVEANISDLEALRTSFNAQTNGNILTKNSTDTFSNEAFGNNFLSSEIKKSSLGGVLQTQLLRTGDGGGVSFQNTGASTFSSISFGSNSAVNSAFNLPKNAGYLATEDIIYWETKNTNDIVNKNSGKIFLGASSGDGSTPSGDVIISNRSQSNVEIELRSDDTTLSSPNDWLIGKIQAGFTSGSYADSYIKFQTHFSNNTNLNDLLTLKGATATINGSLLINNSSAGNAVITLRDSSDRDDIFIDFEGLNGGVNTLVARITTQNDYLNMETKTTTNFNGLRFSTNSTLAMTIDNNQNAIFQNQVGIAKNPASGFTLDVDGTNPSKFRGNVEFDAGVGIGKSPAVGFYLDVDGTNPSIFRGSVSFLGQAVYVSSFPPKYDNGLDLNSGVFNNTIDTASLTANRSINFPNADGTVALVSSSGQLVVDELVSSLGSSTKIDLAAGGGNIDIIVPNSAGGLNPNVDINFKTGSDIRMNLNSIDGIIFHENFIFKNTAGSTYFPLSFNGSVANSLNVGTAILNLPTADLNMGTGNLNINGGNCTIKGDLTINNSTLGIAKITLEDQTDHDDIDILFRGWNGSSLVSNALISTDNNYFNFQTSNNSPMNGIRLSTNNTLAMTIDNNQNAIFQNSIGLGSASIISRLTFPNSVEPKICFYNGGSGNVYGMGVSASQLNYHVGSTAARHVFYSLGDNGDGDELMRINGAGNLSNIHRVVINGELKTEDDAYIGDYAGYTNHLSSTKLLVARKNESSTAIEWATDDSTVNNTTFPTARILCGFTSTNYSSAYMYMQLHDNNNSSYTNTLQITSSNLRYKGSIVAFTGGHQTNLIKDSNDKDFDKDYFSGLIVVSNGKYIPNKMKKPSSNKTKDEPEQIEVEEDTITINNAWVETILSSKIKQKSVIGIFNPFFDVDENFYDNINGIGEGALWVCDEGGDLEIGDYITTSSVKGYGMLQDNEFYTNYTVAKITCDCVFSQSNDLLNKQEYSTYTDAEGKVKCNLDENNNRILIDTGEQYKRFNTRYLLPDSSRITEEEYNLRKANGETVFKSCFVGVIYLCG